MEQNSKRARAFCIFEGGGARGVSHVGALRSFEEVYELQGFAGTSAGAIIAALGASGYKADEILHFGDQVRSSSQRSIFDFLEDGKCKKPAHLFKKLDWIKLRAMRGLIRQSPMKKIAAMLFIGFLLFFPVIELAIHFTKYAPTSLNTLRWILWIMYSLTVISLLGAIWYVNHKFSGLVDLSRLEDKLNKLFALRLGMPEGKISTFGDFHKKGRRLKIVAADVSNKEMALFSTELAHCRDIPVARAVAASVAIPFVFRPATYNGSVYCDGGLVSNLPAWTFDSDLLMDQDCWVLTSEIIDGKASARGGSRFKGLNFVENVARTALFGGAHLNTRGLMRHARVPIISRIGLLDFDANHDIMLSEARTAKLTADLILDRIFLEDQALSLIYGDTLDIFRRYYPEKEGLRLRAALARPVRLPHEETAGYLLWSCRGFDGYADKYLLVPRIGSMIESCLGSRRPKYLNLKDADGKKEFESVCRDGSVQAQTPTDLSWSMAIPLPYDGTESMSVALALDCNLPLTNSSGVRHESVIAELECIVRKYWRPALL